MKSGRFHMKSSGFHEILGHSPHPAFIKLKSFCWNTCCYKALGGFHMKSGWNLPDFTGEICQISRVKSTRFHGWNLPDFKGEIRRISKDQLPGMVSPMFFYVAVHTKRPQGSKKIYVFAFDFAWCEWSIMLWHLVLTLKTYTPPRVLVVFHPSFMAASCS